jgi:hypothetical protein
VVVAGLPWLALAALQPPLAKSALARQRPAIRWPVLPGLAAANRIVILGEPKLTLGSVGGAPPTLLSGVIGAVRLPDGAVAIGDAANHRIVIFDATGSLRWHCRRPSTSTAWFGAPRLDGR